MKKRLYLLFVGMIFLAQISLAFDLGFVSISGPGLCEDPDNPGSYVLVPTKKFFGLVESSSAEITIKSNSAEHWYLDASRRTTRILKVIFSECQSNFVVSCLQLADDGVVEDQRSVTIRVEPLFEIGETGLFSPAAKRGPGGTWERVESDHGILDYFGWPYDPVFDDALWTSDLNGTASAVCAANSDTSTVRYYLTTEPEFLTVMIMKYDNQWKGEWVEYCALDNPPRVKGQNDASWEMDSGVSRTSYKARITGKDKYTGEVKEEYTNDGFILRSDYFTSAAPAVAKCKLWGVYGVGDVLLDGLPSAAGNSVPDVVASCATEGNPVGAAVMLVAGCVEDWLKDFASKCNNHIDYVRCDVFIFKDSWDVTGHEWSDREDRYKEEATVFVYSPRPTGEPEYVKLYNPEWREQKVSYKFKMERCAYYRCHYRIDPKTGKVILQSLIPTGPEDKDWIYACWRSENPKGGGGTGRDGSVDWIWEPSPYKDGYGLTAPSIEIEY